MNQLNGYQVLANCYQSGNTLILKAVRTLDQLPVVIKIPTRPDPNPARSRRLMNEFQIGSAIHSPFVIEYVEVIQAPVGLGLVLEDCDGRPLSEFLNERGMPLDLFLALAENMALGLADIHRHGVIHKDIKPANILVFQGSQIKYIDFGISSRQSQDIATEPEFVSRLEGTLAYISPEQTGRMNRPVDYRTDFYSLGATFYHMLSGQLPFENTDNLELVHSHLARRTRPVIEIRPEVPEVLSLLIEKLMAKSVEARYQSSDGVVEDIRRCRGQWELFGKISSFKLALSDIPERFSIPSRLYGRDAEIKTLKQALDRVQSGTREMLLVTGPAGVGKSTLIHELEKPLLAQQGFFAKGKFNPFADESVYSGLSEAFGKLVGMLLGEEDAVIQLWAEKLDAALGPHASAVIEFIPELEWILGKSASSERIQPENKRSRLHVVMGQFVACFASAKRPLVLFLDDIHLADPASLEMISALMNNSRIHGLLLIGAAREEHRADSLFDFWLEEMAAKGTPVPRLAISPLDLNQLTLLIADTLGLREDRIQPLAETFLVKTGGNPYFAFQLLKTFYRDGLIFIDRETGRWDWSEEKIRAAAIPDNLADLVVARLHKLPPATQKLLQRAACIGGLFSPKLLAQISGLSYMETLRGLDVAREENLVGLPQKSGYAPSGSDLESSRDDLMLRFQHHRVWRTAYERTPEQERPHIHLAIARALWNREPGEPENINVLVHHYNEARTQITDAEELLMLARLNQKQAEKAIHAVAYDTALRFLEIGIDCLPESAWTHHYRLCFDLHFLLAEASYLSRDYVRAQSLSDQLRKRATNQVDRSRAVELEVVYLLTIARYSEAVDLALQGLAYLQVHFARTPSRILILKELGLLRLRTLRRPLEQLVDAVEVSQPLVTAQLNLLMRLNLAAYLSGDVNLYALVAIRRINTLLQHGASPESANAFVTFGLLLSVLGNYDAALTVGKLALQLDERFQILSLRCKILFIYAFTIHAWHYPWKSMLPYFRQALEVGLQTGDQLYSTLAIIMSSHWDPSLPLQDAYDLSMEHREIASQQGLAMDSGLGMMIQRHLLCLMGRTRNRLDLDGDGFQEDLVLVQIKESGFMAGLALYDLIRLELCFLYGAYEKAYYYLQRVEQHNRVLGGTPYIALFCVYQFLVLAALQNGALPPLKLRIKLKRLVHRVENWDKRCPANFRHYLLLLKAELAGLEGDYDTAAANYAAALEAAQTNMFLSFSGVAAETAGRFFLRHGHHTLARSYMITADQAFQIWGAHGKMQHLRETYPLFLTASQLQIPAVKHLPRSEETRTLVQGEGRLVKVFHIAESLFSEIDYHRLCAKLLRAVRESTQAANAALIMLNGGKWWVEETFHADFRQGATRVLLNECDQVCQRAIRETVALQGPLLLNEASTTVPYSHDPYILRHGISGLLCCPIRFKDQLRGVIYLDTAQGERSFDEDDLACITILCGPAAISLENALLYTQSQAAAKEVADLNRELAHLNEELEARVLERTAELEKVQAKLVERAHYEGMSEIATAVLHNVGSVLNSVLTSCQTIGDTIQGSRMPGLLRANEMLRDNFERVDEFLAHDPKGQDLMRYYLELDKHYLREKGLVQENAARLIDLVESIRGIIMAQQSYARSSFLPEPIQVDGAIDDALGLLSGDLIRSQVKVTRNYQEAPALTLPKNKLINLAVSLIRNAIEAMESEDNTLRVLTINVSLIDERLVVAFSDTGLGIDPCRLESIFGHGYSTKARAKGFGLHAAANAMTEMGGSIKAYSAGPGQGATFTLSFPLV